MGLIHSRASKKRDRAAAGLLKEQARAARDERRGAHRADSAGQLQEREVAAAELPAWRQPTLGGALRKLAEGRQQQEAGDDG
jgi:hypothetical protein